MKKWIKYCRMIYVGLSAAFYVIVLVVLLKGALTRSALLHSTSGWEDFKILLLDGATTGATIRVQQTRF